MPIREIRLWWAYCDYCEWYDSFETGEEAADALIAHNKEKHPREKEVINGGERHDGSFIGVF